MFDPLLTAEPSFRAEWDPFITEWGGEPDLMAYTALAVLARHLIRKLAADDVATFGAVFDVVERWHLEGDAYVREAATIGLLEDLQNLNLHDSTRPDAFRPWLRPTTLRFWRKVEAFWRDGVLITDD